MTGILKVFNFFYDSRDMNEYGFGDRKANCDMRYTTKFEIPWKRIKYSGTTPDLMAYLNALEECYGDATVSDVLKHREALSRSRN